MLSTTTLLSLRLRWYAASTARLLLRRWQAVLLALGILAPAGASLLSNIDSLAYPVLLLSAPGHGLAWRFGYLLALFALAALWALMQREQIAGGGFMRFAGSLPLPLRYTRLTDALVLALADSPLWLPLLAALVAGVPSNVGATMKAANLLFLCDLALFILLIQLAALQRRFIVGLAVAALGLICLASIGSAFQLGACALAAEAAVVLLARPLPRDDARILALTQRALAPFAAARLAIGRRLHPALLVSLGILARQRRSETIGKLLVAGAVTLVAALLMSAWDYDARAFPLSIVAQAAMALTLSGLYRGLRMAHGDAARFCDALPLPRRWPRRFDVAVVTAFGLPFFAALGAALLLHGAAPTAGALAGVASAAALLGALRLPQLYRDRHAVVLSLLATAAWAALTIIFLT